MKQAICHFACWKAIENVYLAMQQLNSRNKNNKTGYLSYLKRLLIVRH